MSLATAIRHLTSVLAGSWPVVIGGLIVSTARHETLRDVGRWVQNSGLVIAVTAAALLLASAWIDGRSRRLVPLLPIGAWAGWLAVRNLASDIPVKGLSGAFAIVGLAAATYGAIHRSERPQLMLAWVATAALLTSWVLRLLGSPLVDTTYSGRFIGIHLKVSTFAELGSFVALMGAMELGRRNGLAVFWFTLGLASLGASLSRAPTLGLLAGLLVLGATRRQWSWRRVVTTMSVFAMVVAVASLFVGPTSFSGPGRLLNSGLNGRGELWAYAWDKVIERPVIGNGYGAYRYDAERDAGAGIVAFDERGAHNLLLAMLYEVGIIGVSIAVGIVWSTWRRRRTSQRRRDPAFVAVVLASMAPMTLIGGSLMEATSWQTVLALLLVGLVGWQCNTGLECDDVVRRGGSEANA